jgi:phenylpropionate dioxygenase-like ring-hydroxylating dioxygenase large terminal subunit
MTLQPSATSPLTTSEPSRFPAWARAIANGTDFQAEQEKLGHIWTFLGFTSDIPTNNDWFRTTLGGRSIFVQRFQTEIRAFVNRCAHRYYPLRTSDRGNGPIVCGFHHWRYNRNGLAVGIPNCQSMFGKTPREMNQRLLEVEIAQCGTMIFGRFPNAGAAANPTLEEWLDDGFPILNHFTRTPLPSINRMEANVAANWRLMMQISLDDYHLVAVHPATFGKTGYLKPEATRYFRFGAHSAYFTGAPEEEFSRMVKSCRAGTFVPNGYRIFQFFPNLIVTLIRAFNYLGDRYWFIHFQQLTPEGHDRTRSVSRFGLVPFSRPAGFIRRSTRKLAAPWITLGFVYYARRTNKEDNEVVEQLQRYASSFGDKPRRAEHEKRISWFDESYSAAMAAPADRAAMRDRQ